MALEPPEDVLDAVAAALEPVRAVPAGLRFEPRERYHLTLQFLGTVHSLGAVVGALSVAVADRSAFPFRLGGAGAFPKPGRARVVWIGAEAGGGELAGLAGAVHAALRPFGYEPDHQTFHPHLTVARLKVPDNVVPVLEAIGQGPVGASFTVSEVVLYRSELSSKGPAYTVLERFPLRNT